MRQPLIPLFGAPQEEQAPVSLSIYSCVRVFARMLYLCAMYLLGAVEDRRVCWIPGSGITDDREPSCKCWESDVFLWKSCHVAEPSFQAMTLTFVVEF